MRAEVFDHRPEALRRPPGPPAAPRRPAFIPPPVDDAPQGPPISPTPGLHRGPPPAAPAAPDPTVLGTRPEIGGLRFGGLTPLTPLAGLLICAAADGLVGIDVAAARRRVRFDRLVRRPGDRALARPVSIELDADARARLVQRGADLKALGFGIEPFGGATHVIERVPAALPPDHAEAALRAALAAPLDADDRPQPALADACLDAAPDDAPISPDEARALLTDLDAVEAEAPRSRPLAFALTAAELRRALTAP